MISMWTDFKNQVAILKSIDKLGCAKGLYDFAPVITNSRLLILKDKFGSPTNLLLNFYEQVSDGFNAYKINNSNELCTTKFLKVYRSKLQLEANAIEFSGTTNNQKNFLLLDGENIGKIVSFSINFDVRDANYYINKIEPIYSNNFHEWLMQKLEKDIFSIQMVLNMMKSNHSYQDIQKASRNQTHWIIRIAGIDEPLNTKEPIPYEINNFNGRLNERWEQLILKNWRQENL